jgi:hypothetical protein
MEYLLKAGVFFLATIGATGMEPIETGFMLVLYVVPVLILFAVMAGIADYMENRK